MQASILLTRVKRLPDYIAARRRNAAIYNDGLQEFVTCPVERKNEFHTYHVYVIQCDRRDQLQSYLLQKGIETKVHYPIPIHQQEAAKYLGYGPGSLPKTEEQAKRILSLPINQYTWRMSAIFIGRCDAGSSYQKRYA
jgi:dTDP-4-amino-4,6-dideoxygalactose transaminase